MSQWLRMCAGTIGSKIEDWKKGRAGAGERVHTDTGME